MPVHPRACGERHLCKLDEAHSRGSSPRLRGTLFLCRFESQSARFIPAPAGNALNPLPAPCLPPVHPRACGERCIAVTSSRSAIGSSPRLRGTQHFSARGRLCARFIPAPAGNATWPAFSSWLASVHPRACGERMIPIPHATQTGGSSPRLRGTLYTSLFRACGFTVHPRACGERIASGRTTSPAIGSSPRLRGTRLHACRMSDPTRFIPAPAGNAAPRSAPGQRPAVHPRACGERSRRIQALGLDLGSSPRLRGTHP